MSLVRRLLDDHLENSAGKEVILEVNYIIYHRFSLKNTDNLKQVIVSFDCLHLALSLGFCVKIPVVPKICICVNLTIYNVKSSIDRVLQSGTLVPKLTIS